MRIAAIIKKKFFTVTALITITFIACSKSEADFSLLLARIEQRPGSVSEKLLTTIINKAVTIQQKMALLNFCISYDQESGQPILHTQHKQLILKRLLQNNHNETIRYCAFSILYDEGCIDDIFYFLKTEDISLYPEFCCELFLTYPERIFDVSWITPDHYALLAAKTNSAELYVLASVHCFLLNDKEHARLFLVQALANGIHVHPVLLWYAGLYEALLEHYGASADYSSLVYVLDAAYEAGRLDIIESCLQKIENSGTVTKKVKNVRAYYYYKKSQEFAQKNKNMPWTHTYQEENDFLQKAFALLQDDSTSFYNIASYAAVLFHSGNFEAYSQVINCLPDTADFEYLRFLYALQFKKSNSLKSYLIKIITTSSNAQLVEDAFLTLIHHEWWEDFAVLYKQAKTNNFKIKNNFLDFVFFLIESDKIVQSDTCFDLLNMTSESYFVSINKAKLYLLHNNPKEAEIILEDISKNDLSVHLRKYICDLLIEVEKTLHNEAKLQYYIQQRDELQSRITAVNISN